MLILNWQKLTAYKIKTLGGYVYSKNFSKIYAEYDWDYFSITMFDALMDYFKENNILICNHLDIGCGIGTLCNCFYGKNIKTEGFDLSPHMIAIAKDRYKKINFQILDMVNFSLNRKYDLITCTCDAINHLNSVDDIKTTFINVYNHLENKGLFIFDILDKKNIPLNEKVVSERNNNIKVNYLFTFNGIFLNTNVVVTKNKKTIYEGNVKELLVKEETIIEMLKKIGFKILLCSDTIYHENQRFKDKLYFICEK